MDDHVVNELYDNYALQSRIEIGGYSMTYYRDILNELFFDVDSVLDPTARRSYTMNEKPFSALHAENGFSYFSLRVIAPRSLWSGVTAR